MFLKICGITRLVDARHAVAEGATALGFVLWPQSPRFVSNRKVAEIVAALPGIVTVGVFVNQPPEVIAGTMEQTGLTTVQLHGDEPATHAGALARWPWTIWKSVTLEHAESVFEAWPRETTFLVDAADPVRRGGTGRAVDWTGAAALAQRRHVILAGGLSPDNIAEAIAAVRPYGVDVSSGVEDAPGLKNPTKIARFLARARHAAAALENQERRKRMQ